MSKRLDYIQLGVEYPKRGKQLYRHLIPLKGLLQKNYGKRFDCTLTSLACIFGEEYYATIERIAEKYGYDGDKNGTNPLVVRCITQELAKRIKVKGKAKSAYGKSIGWTWGMVKRLIAKNTPVVLNLWDDGRKYYHDHTVTIVGVEEYQNGKFLIVLDNWNESVSLIDYNKLCVISSINWFEKG